MTATIGAEAVRSGNSWRMVITEANAALARDLAEIAALLRARREDRFRVRAYQDASRVMRALPVPASELSDAELRRLDGVGPAVAGLIAEHVGAGRIAWLERLRDDEPEGFGALLQLPLVGVRDARKLSGKHGVTSVEALQSAVADPTGSLDLDERLAARARESLRRLPTVEDPRMPRVAAHRASAALAERLTSLATVEESVVAGGARRGADRTALLAVLVVLGRGATTSDLLDALVTTRGVVRVLSSTSASVEVLSSTGHPLIVWCAEPAVRGAALVHATGAPEHTSSLDRRAAVRGLELRHDGVWSRDGGGRVAGRTEADVYAALGVPTIPPELREGAGEVEAADRGVLPSLVRAQDLRGDLHVHSDWSRDGREPLEAMVDAAADRGYDYVALTDHAENLTINGMARESVHQRRQLIAEVQPRHPHVRLLDAAELNIDLAGSLDYDLELLLSFDLGVASIHSHMDRPAAQQTDRILTAIASPAVHVIGHPTGRIIGRRPGYEIDLHAIAQAAAETGTALETNGSPSRLDLDDTMVRTAVRAGAPLSLSSDAHTLRELGNITHAVTTARRGWAGADDVVNALDLDALLAFTARKRRRCG